MFPKTKEMVKTRRALSKVLPPQRHRGLLVLIIPTGFLESPQPYWRDFLLPGHIIPEEAAGVGCSNHPSHPSPWFCNTAEGGRSWNPARSSRISLRPRVPGVQPPKQGQGWSTNRPEEFITSSRNREPSTQLLLPLPLSPAAWTPFHGPRGSPGFPDSGARKEASQGLGGSSPHISPKGATEQTRRSFKDIPKSKYLKC